LSPNMPSYLSDDISPQIEYTKGWNTKITVGGGYAHLNEKVKDYINLIENNLGVKANLISVGPGRDELFELNS